MRRLSWVLAVILFVTASSSAQQPDLNQLKREAISEVDSLQTLTEQMVDELAFEPTTSSLRTVGKISSGKAPQSLSCFHEALNWQTWQTGFLFVFSVQFDGEKPDKITGGACACNDDKVIFENPLIYSAAVFRVPGMN